MKKTLWAFLLLFLLLPSIVLGERLQPSDLTYQGAFRLPDSFNWGARGLSFYSPGNGGSGSLFITGFEGLLNDAGAPCDGAAGCKAYYGELSIPEPGTEIDWENLPVATFLRSMTAFDGGLIQTLNTDYVFVSGIQYIPRQGSQTGGKIYGSLDAWYPEGDFGDDSFPTIWFSSPDGTGARGLFSVGPETAPYHGRKMGDYLFAVPQWYADRYLGGRILLTGRARGTPAGDHPENTTQGGSQGPTLFAFQPWQTENPVANTSLDAIPLLYYRVKYPGCAGPDIGVGGEPVDCDYVGFSMCDAWSGGGFVEAGAKNAVLILGHKGSTNCYYCGDPLDDSECSKTPLSGECDLFCGESRGYHCGPYERQIIFYDTDELGQAAQGAREPWTVLPYTIWRPTSFYLKGDAQGNVCEDAGGMAVDDSGRRLFMIERGLGTENAAVVHVWQYNATSSCPDCSGDTVVLKNVIFGTDGNCECSAATSITIGPDVTIQNGATVNFNAPVVKIGSGLVIERGATVHINQPDGTI
jgi:hypothetical protein